MSWPWWFNSNTVVSCNGTFINLYYHAKQMFVLHNQARAQRGLPLFCVHPALWKAARKHSWEMLQQDYYSHSSANGEPFYIRLQRYGYLNYRTVGENIAWASGYRGEPYNIFNGWMNSEVHRENILNPGFREIGFGRYVGEYRGMNNVTMWTVDFGAR